MIIPRQTGTALSLSTTLQGPLLTLRAPLIEDYREWAKLRGDSRAFLTPWEALWHPDALTEIVYGRRLRRTHAEWRDDEGYTFHLFAKNRLIGGIGLTQIRRGIAQAGLLGYWIGEAHARQGYMTEATGLVLDLAFSRLGLHRVEASCIPENIASCTLLQNLGFRQEGFARSYLKIAGEWADHNLYSIVEDEWRQGLQT